MSRCFPYPPPGYYRNGATHDALIESIKLQKETNKTKSDRKKEKKNKKEKKEKRHREKRNNEGSYTVLQNSAYCTAAQINASTELLEKSDLTQEHGQPVNQHQPSYSSDSTENSNKRKRDDHSFITDNSSGNGSFKIRLTKKQKGSDSSSIAADVRSNTNSSLSSFTSDRGLVSCIGKNGVYATFGRENRTQIQTQTTSNLVSKGTTIGDLNRVHFGRIQAAPSSAKPFLQSTRPQQQVLPRFHLEHEAPSSFVSTNVNEQGLHFARQQQLATCYRGVSNLVTNKTSTSDAGRTSINEVSVAVNGGLTKQKEDPQKVGPSRSEKKMLKKQAKYEKLIGSWLPPVFQADVHDDDWLSSSKTSSSSILKGEVETCRESVASWQPCARFLAEADIHALPYTVPF